MSVNEKMTAIADEIRVLSGTTDTMGLDAMATHVGDANTQIANQQDLIAQIATALEGKAGGGSGGQMSGVCPSLTVDGDSTISTYKIFYSTNGQYTTLFNDENGIFTLPFVIQNIDVGQPIIFTAISYNGPGVDIEHSSNLEALILDEGDTGTQIYRCTTTSAATLILREVLHM